MTEMERIILRGLTLCIIMHVYRHVMHHTLIKIVSQSLQRTARHLVLPLFAFILFNITFGVIFYFLEPCYNISECHWHDLFEATVYSVVTMTTVGYGNQYPQVATTRFLAVLVMVFGSLYLSMPLALMGNEYVEVMSELDEEKRKEREAIELRLKGFEAIQSTYHMDIDELLSLTEASIPLTDLEEKLQRIASHHLMVYAKKLKELSKLLIEESLKNKILTPHMVMVYCELRAVIEPMEGCLRSTIKEVSKTWAAAHEEIAAKEVEDKAANANMKAHIFEQGLDTDDQEDEGEEDDEEDDIDDDDDDDSSDDSSDDSDFSDLEVYSNDSDNTKRKKTAMKIDKEAEEALEKRKAAKAAGQDYDSSSSDSDGDGDHKIGISGNELKDAETHLKEEHGDHIKILDGDEELIVDIHNRDFNDRKSTRKSNFMFALAKMLRSAGTVVKALENMGMGKSHDRAWKQRMRNLLLNDKSLLRERVWALLNVPASGLAARFLHTFTLMLIIGSLALFYMETNPYFQNYGETTLVCGDVLRNYCADKGYGTDPGCYVQAPGGLGATTTALVFPDSVYLSKEALAGQDDCYATYSGSSFYDSSSGTFAYSMSYNYTSALDGSSIILTQPLNECFGHGYNFGTTRMANGSLEYAYTEYTLVTDTNVTCLLDISGSQVYPELDGFQSQVDLDQKYKSRGASTAGVHKRHAICQRPECAGIPAGFSLKDTFTRLEVFANSIFSIDFVLRLWVSNSFLEVFTNKMLIVDFLALLPFYANLIDQSYRPNFEVSSLDFTIMSSSPKPYLLTFSYATKLFRAFKLTTAFRASGVLALTAKKVGRQILAMMSMFTMALFCFAILFYELERGKECYVGDDGCEIPDVLEGTVVTGDRIQVNKYGQPTKFTNVIDAFWFCFVSATTVGYGDIIPVTSQGWTLNFALMLFGTVFMVFPLTAASTTFYTMYSRFLLRRTHLEEKDEKDNLMKINIFNSPLYPNGFSQDIQKELTLLMNDLKGREMAMRIYSTDLHSDVASKYHDEHLKDREASKIRREELAKKQAELEKTTEKKRKAKERKAKRQAQLAKENEGEAAGGDPDNNNPAAAYDDDDDDDADESGDEDEVIKEARKLEELHIQREQEELLAKEEEIGRLLERSAYVAQMHEIAFGVNRMIEANMYNLEILTHFEIERIIHTTKIAKITLQEKKEDALKAQN
jgi:hypothetical protein